MKRFLGVLIASLAVVGAAATLNRTNASDKAAPTFAKDVAPIIFNKCATCHRPGEAVPMSLTSYQEVRPWAKAVKEQVIEHTMPPWYADPASSLKFRNDRRLSQKEIDTIVLWVDAGSPKGDDADLPAAHVACARYRRPRFHPLHLRNHGQAQRHRAHPRRLPRANE